MVSSQFITKTATENDQKKWPKEKKSRKKKKFPERSFPFKAASLDLTLQNRTSDVPHQHSPSSLRW